MTASGRPLLQLVDPASAAPEAVLGLWAVDAPAGDVVFDLPATPDARPPVWRVALPAEPGAASARLAQAESELAAADRGLGEALARLEQFAWGRPGNVDFAVGAPGEAPGPAPGEAPPRRNAEARLAALLGGPRPPAAAPAGGLAFDVGGTPAGDTWQAAGQQFVDYVERLARFVAHYAWVETYGGEQRIAWTVVGWDGALDTWWPAQARPEDRELHHGALHLALGSRAAMLRTFVLAARGAVILARAGATPLGPVLTMPAAWRFIQDVLVELRQHEPHA